MVLLTLPLAIRINFIADWKTGKVEEEDTSLQLLPCTMGDSSKGISKDSINSKAYLIDARLEELEYSEKHWIGTQE